MRVIIRSEKEAVMEIKNKPNFWDVISIRDFISKNSPVDDSELNCKSIIKLFFDDIFYRYEETTYQKLAKKEDIKAALEFSKDKNNILVHCGAGISRSSAIAYIILSTTMLPSKAIEKLSFENHYPNEHIVKLGAKILSNKEIITSFEEKYGISLDG
jgi:predicted protein tyrosine phosphatase